MDFAFALPCESDRDGERKERTVKEQCGSLNPPGG